jgi:dolichyl-phosphate-mannose-protein mannosyltransferase
MTTHAASTAAASSAGASRGQRATRPRLTPLRISLAVGSLAAAAQAAVVVPFLGRYGWNRDELYFLSAARRSTWGYVDFPPVTAWIAWLVHATFGDSLVALRATSLVATMLTVVLVALMARELGGGPRTQAIAALVWGLSPYGLAGGSVFHPTWLDVLCWVALLYTVVVALARRRPRLWLAAGVIAGIGIETKYTIAFLLAALLVALVASDRRAILRTGWPWLGLGIALLLLLPNLVWEAQHSWPSIHFFQSQNADTASDSPPATYLAQQLLFLGGLLVVAVVGVVSLWRRAGLRPIAILPPLITVFFLLERGRSYYPLPADSVAVAAGVVALAAWLRDGGRRRRAAVAALVVLQAVVLALALPVVLPVRSTASMVSSGVWKDSFYKDEIGWPELADQTATAWRSLAAAQRAEGAIVAGNYGEASALELYGPARGLPQVLSGHLSWQYWRPQSLPQRYALFVGYDPGTLSLLCRSWTKLATIDNRWHIANEERGRIIAGCRLPRPLGVIWQRSIARNNL